MPTPSLPPLLSVQRSWRSLMLLWAIVAPLAWAHDGPHPARPATTSPPEAVLAAPLSVNVPDVLVTDHEGRRLRFGTDLVKGRTVLVNFIFTGCTSVCSPLTAIMKATQEQLTAAGKSDVQIVTVTVDPLNDTPERLRAYASAIGAGGPKWRFVTGTRASIDAILKGFGVPLGGNLDDHTPMVFVGRGEPQRWARAYGLAGPKAIVSRVLASAPTDRNESVASLMPVSTRAAAAPAAGSSALPGIDNLKNAAAQHATSARPQRLAAGDAASYFTNLPVITHDRGRVRFYDDLVRDRIVLVHAFYTGCGDVCSPVGFNLAQVQAALAKQAGSPPVQIISLSVDAVADTPEVLTAYAQRHGAGPGWSFVTGKKENVDWVLSKLGLYVAEKEQHQAALWVGNDRTQTWLKLHALAPPAAIVAAVRKLM